MDEFDQQLQARLDEGAKEYGNASFDRPADEIIGEVEQECVDVVGWCWVLARNNQRSWPRGRFTEIENRARELWNTVRLLREDIE